MNELYINFKSWLDCLFDENDMPEETVAFCFNLYEEEKENSIYSVQFVACDNFDEKDDEWACDEVWTSGEDVFYFELSDEDDRDREAAQELIKSWVEYYMEGRSILQTKPVGIGFVDSDDIEIIGR